MTPEEKDAIRSRNAKRHAAYGESEQKADGEMWTVGGEDDVDALLAEVERLEAALNARRDMEIDLLQITEEMRDCYRILRRLTPQERGLVLCWFCPVCHAYIRPWEQCPDHK